MSSRRAPAWRRAALGRAVLFFGLWLMIAGFNAADLPVGWTDEQAPGLYRIRKRDDSAHFGYVVGPHSWKKFLFPPSHTLWSAKRTEDGIEVKPASDPPQRTAFIGVRACELAAIAVQDGVLMNGSFVDADYKARRENALLVAVNCGQAGGTCSLSPP